MKEACTRLINIAAQLVQGKDFDRLIQICEGQKTISTEKLLRIIENIHNDQKSKGMYIRISVDEIRGI